MAQLTNGKLYKTLFENLLNGFAFCEGIFKDGHMVDFTYIKVNQAFEYHTGLKDVEGKRVSEVIPNIYIDDPQIFEIYERVAQGGPKEFFERYLNSLKIWFRVSVYSLELGTFVAVFENITDEKNYLLELQRANEEVRKAYDETLITLVYAGELRDMETADHSKRVTEMTSGFAEYIHIDKKYHIDIWRGALLHDIGKIGVSDTILRKPDRLTHEEMAQMQRHPQLAYDMLHHITYLQQCTIDIPYCHHERYDGSGYPRGLKGADIPLCARMFAIIDVYDAMTTDRPYRKALTQQFTLTYLSVQSGILFDPRLVKRFLSFVEGR